MIRNIKLLLIVATHIMALATSSVATSASLAGTGPNVIKNNLLFLRNGDIWVYDVQNRSEIQLTNGKNITNYCASAEANKVAYVVKLKKLFVYDVSTGVEELVADLEADASQPSFSPRGDKIALISLTKKKIQVTINTSTTISQKARHVWIVDLKTKKMVDVTKDIPYQHSQVSWSPDGKRLSFASYRLSGPRAYPYIIDFRISNAI